MLKKVFIFLFLFITVIFFATVIIKVEGVHLPTTDTCQLFANSTSQDIEKGIVHSILDAKKSIFLAIFALSDFKVINALRAQADKGIEVFVVIDKKASSNAPRYLGKNVKIIRRETNALMHLKLLVIDGNLTWIGSANLTKESLTHHMNLMTVIDSESFGEMAEDKIKSFASNVFRPFTYREFSLKEQTVELSFLPDNQNAVRKIIYLIDSAKTSLRIALFTWTRVDFAKAVIAAKRRGVDVEVILDRTAAEGAGLEVMELLTDARVDVYLNQGSELMHNKFMWIDESILVNGSANWTKRAFKDNDDCFIVLKPTTDEQNAFLMSLWKEMKFFSKLQ